MHSSRMRTIRSLPYRGYLSRGDLKPERDLCPGGVSVSPPVNRMTDMSKNITLPQTSFVGSNNNTVQLVYISYQGYLSDV